MHWAELTLSTTHQKKYSSYQLHLFVILRIFFFCPRKWLQNWKQYRLFYCFKENHLFKCNPWATISLARSRTKHAEQSSKIAEVGVNWYWWHSISLGVVYHLDWNTGPVVEAIPPNVDTEYVFQIHDKLRLHSTKNQNLDSQPREWSMTARNSRHQATMWPQLEEYMYIHDINHPWTGEGRK